MRDLHPHLRGHLNLAASRWKWIRFAEHTATIGTIVTLLALAVGIGALWGVPATKAFFTLALALLIGGGFLVWLLVGVLVDASIPNDSRLARAIERVCPSLLDRLNTLVFLRGESGAREMKPFYTRIESQAHSELMRQDVPYPFSPKGAVIRLAVFVAILIATLWFYEYFAPLQRFGGARAAPAVQQEPPLEIPPDQPQVTKEQEFWGEVKITQPGRDLVVPSTATVELQIEAAASDPLTAVQWFTSINGGEDRRHDLPPPGEPRSAAYRPAIDVGKFGLANWDVMTYYAQAEAAGNMFASTIYFLEVRPAPQQLEELPGGEEGKAFSLMDELSRMIQYQERVLEETHRQRFPADKDADAARAGPPQLARAEDELATATRHVAAQVPPGLEKPPDEQPIAHLAQAEDALHDAAGDFRARSLADAEPHARAALRELVEARKELQQQIDANAGRFGVPLEGHFLTPEELAEILKQLDAAEKEARAAAAVVRKLAEKQRGIAGRTQPGQAEYKASFTTGLDSRNRPRDNVEEISINDDRVYLYTAWRALTEGEHRYGVKIFDGAGHLATSQSLAFTPTGAQWNTWTWHQPEPAKNKPGDWKFEVQLDGRKAFEKTLRVNSGPKGTKAGPAEAPEAPRSPSATPRFKNSLQPPPGRVSAAVLEHPDNWTRQYTGTARLLVQAGFDMKVYDVDRSATEQGVDAIVFGSFVSDSNEYQRHLREHAAGLATFVENGGVVVQFTQAAQTEAEVPFLPPGLSAKRSGESVGSLFVRSANHPLLIRWASPARLNAVVSLPFHLGRAANWNALMEHEGFRVLLSSDQSDRYPALLEGEYGKGRVLLTSLFLDKQYDASGKVVAPTAYANAARGFFAGLRDYVGLVKQGGAAPIAASPSAGYRRVAAADYPQLAREEDGLRGEFADFEKQFPNAVQSVPAETGAARDALDRAADSLGRRSTAARDAATSAAVQLDRLADSLEQQFPGRQLVNAYRLKELLDRQIRQLEQLEQNPDAMTPEQRQELAQAMKATARELKRIAEQEPTRRLFGEPLREALNDENLRQLDTLCEGLARSRGGEATQQAAGEAKSAMQGVSRAFEASQPWVICRSGQSGFGQPMSGAGAFLRGITGLQGLCQALRQGGRPSGTALAETRERALSDLQRGMEELGIEPPEIARLIRPLRQTRDLDPALLEQIIQSLLEQTGRVTIERAEIREEPKKKPDGRYIDPATLPPAYRERIQKYFEKLSQE